MSTPEQINKALAGLDANNENHWTADGLPRLDTVKILAGDQSITREAVTLAAPGYSRATPLQAPPAAPSVPAPPVAETAPAAPTAAATQETVAPPPPVEQAPAPAPVVNAPTGLPPVEATSPSALAAVPAVDNIEALKQATAELADVEEQLLDVNKVLAHVTTAKRELLTKGDDLRIRIEKLTPRHDNQHAIQAYLASQRQALQNRADQIGMVRKIEADLGFKLKDLMPKRSPIDNAMARKAGHGLNRPK